MSDLFQRKTEAVAAALASGPAGPRGGTFSKCLIGMLLLLTLLTACTQSEPQPFTLHSYSFAESEGACATGSEVAIDASIVFSLSGNSSDGCDVFTDSDWDLRIHPPVAAHGGAVTVVSRSNHPMGSTAGDCARQLRTVLRMESAGLLQLEVVIRKEFTTSLLLEIRDAAGLFVSLDGHRGARMLAGTQPLLVLALADGDGNPLRGEPPELIAGESALSVEKDPFGGYWRVVPETTGSYPLSVKVGTGPEIPFTLEVIDPAQTELRFFKLEIGEHVTGVLWPATNWTLLAEEPLVLQRFQADSTRVIAVPTHNGESVAAGAYAVTYVVQQLPIIQTSVEGTHYTFNTGGTSREDGIEWLVVQEVNEGTEPITARGTARRQRSAWRSARQNKERVRAHRTGRTNAVGQERGGTAPRRGPPAAPG